MMRDTYIDGEYIVTTEDGKEVSREINRYPVISNIPQQVTMRQARIALYNAGKLATVNAAISAMTGAAGDAARIEWEFSSTVERNKPLVTSMGAVLSMDSTALDALFVAAAAL